MNIAMFMLIDGMCITCILLETTMAFIMGQLTKFSRSLMILSSAYSWIFGFCYFGDRLTRVLLKILTNPFINVISTCSH